jgi:hypothetical protein
VSRVSIEIDGVRWGLRIPPRLAMQLVEALQGLWVAESRDAGMSNALDLCEKAHDAIVEHIGAEARKDRAAAELGLVKVDANDLLKLTV